MFQPRRAKGKCDCMHSGEPDLKTNPPANLAIRNRSQEHVSSCKTRSESTTWLVAKWRSPESLPLNSSRIPSLNPNVNTYAAYQQNGEQSCDVSGLAKLVSREETSTRLEETLVASRWLKVTDSTHWQEHVSHRRALGKCDRASQEKDLNQPTGGRRFALRP